MKKSKEKNDTKKTNNNSNIEEKKKDQQKNKQKQKKEKEKEEKKEIKKDTNIISSNNNNSKSKNINNNKKLKEKKNNFDEYQFIKYRNIIEDLSSKQSIQNFNIGNNTITQTSNDKIIKDDYTNDDKTINNYSINNQSKENFYEKLNTISAFTLSNEKSINNNNSNINLKNNNYKKKNILSINPYNYYKKGINKEKNIQKKWESNILNLTTKENKEGTLNYNTEINSKMKSKSKFSLNDSFVSNISKNYPYIYRKKYYNTTYNSGASSTKSLINKSSHKKLNSSELLLNKIKKDIINQHNIKNNSMTAINFSQKKKNINKSNNESYSTLNGDKSFKIEKIKKKSKYKNDDNIKNYFGPIDIGLISLKKKEESINEIITKMKCKGFECKLIKSNFIRCNKKGRIIEIEIVKIKGNLLYYLTKKVH